MASEPTGTDDAMRRRRAARAGHSGVEVDARDLLDDPVPSVRATALGALARAGVLTSVDLRSGLADASPLVRRRAAREAAAFDMDLVAVLGDADPLVAEMAAWSIGEQADRRPRAIDALAEMAGGHADALCREAAVAALGAIGDARGLSAIFAALADKPAVRRRAVIALAPFEGPDVDAALRRALEDRDWQVRQAAEDQLS